MNPLSTRSRRWLLVGLIVLLMLAAWRLPILSGVTGQCRLEPGAVWAISESGTGEIRCGWVSNFLGVRGEERLIEFERNDVATIELAPKIKEGGLVNRGDTVATIVSMLGETSIRELEGLLASANATVEALRAGGRPADIEVAKLEFAHEAVQLDAYRPEYVRAESLYVGKTISISELQIVKGEYETRSAAVKWAKAKVDALEAGGRPEDIAVAEREVERLEKLLAEAVSRQVSRQFITSPLTGIARVGINTGETIRIEKTDSLIALITLPEASVLSVNAGQPVEITLVSGGKRTKSKVDRVTFGGTPVKIPVAVSVIENVSGRYLSGMRGRASISTASSSFFSDFWGKMREKFL